MANRKNRWRATDMSSRGGQARFMVENDDKRIHSNGHCVCCALSDAIAQHGGDADLRGLHSYGICYQFLAVLVRASRDGDNSEPDEEE